METARKNALKWRRLPKISRVKIRKLAWLDDPLPMTTHRGLVARLERFRTSGPPLFYIECAEFIGEKAETRCASCRTHKKKATPAWPYRR
jgi:hypothetical protein